MRALENLDDGHASLIAALFAKAVRDSESYRPESRHKVWFWSHDFRTWCDWLELNPRTIQEAMIRKWQEAGYPLPQIASDWLAGGKAPLWIDQRFLPEHASDPIIRDSEGNLVRKTTLKRRQAKRRQRAREKAEDQEAEYLSLIADLTAIYREKKRRG